MSDTTATVHRKRLFHGICLALIPTGASFALVSNILTQLKQEFILTNYQVGLIAGAALWGMAISLLVLGPMLEGFGLKNGTRMAFLGHLAGITIMIGAVTQVGNPSAFWILMFGAAVLAVGNGMIEVAGNPLVAALYPDEKTTRLNWFHAFFPIGIVAGGIIGFLLATYGGGFGRWPFQLAVIYIPILTYGAMVLTQTFPKTENAQAGLPVGEMFRYTFTSPLFLLILVCMAIAVSLELGPMRWIPSVLESAGMHGILVLVWTSGWMVVLRLLAHHFVDRLSPTGMLLIGAMLLGTGLFLLSFVDGLLPALGAATLFAWGVAFNFPTIVGLVSERLPRTGSLGIVLTAGVGLGAAGAIGVPLMGRIADVRLAASLPEIETLAVLQQVEQRFPAHIAYVDSVGPAQAGFRAADIAVALDATRAALAEHTGTGSVQNDATANALRAVSAAPLPDEPLVAEAAAIVVPAEAAGGQWSFRYIAPSVLVLILVWGLMYLADRRRGGYRAERIETTRATPATLGILLLFASAFAAGTPLRAQAPDGGRVKVLFLGDNGHHQPYARAKEVLPALAQSGIDLFYTDRTADLNDAELDRYHVLMLYNNHANVSDEQLAALLAFVHDGGGLVVLHSASASFQNSETFIRLIGAAFKSHGTGTFSATRVASDHPALRNVPVWVSWDETYVHTKHNPVNRTVLEVRSDGAHEEPWTWVKPYGQGRVFYTAWGHDQRTWSTDGFHAMLVQATRWSAGDWALSQQLVEPDPQLVDLEKPIPTYQRPPAPWNTPGDPITKAPRALPTDESLELATLRPGFRAEPFAFEPMIGNIIDFTWDSRGRMWAIETNDYPNDIVPDSIVLPSAGPYPGAKDRILIIEDRDNDNRADNVIVFADGLNLATSLVLANGGVIVGQAPHMLFFRDTNGDDVADERRILFTGWPRGDTHGAISNLRWGFDNQILGSVGYNGYRGTVGNTTVPRGNTVGAIAAGYYRFPADGSSIDYLGRTSNNTWGVALSEDGYVFGSTANGRPSNFVHIPGRYYRDILGMREPVLPGIQDRIDVYAVRELWQVDYFDAYTAGSGHEIYTARLFPEEYWNRIAFVAEPTAHVIGMFELTPDRSTFRAKNRWSFMASRDAWAAPVQVKVGPDGAIWVSDFYTLIAQHNPVPKCCGFENGPGAAYVTPNRDRLHGRIYRILPENATPAERTRLDNATPQQIVAALSNDNMFWRMTAQQRLVEGRHTEAIPALIALVNDQTVDGLGLNVGALHALWTLHGLGAIDSNPAALAAVRNALNHPAASVRRAALDVLPRDERLLSDIIRAGILPDRSSPHDVDYTVGSGLLQDADAHVRVQAVLAVAGLPASARAAATLHETLFTPVNARDPWLPDAIAIAGVVQGPQFATDLLQRTLPQETDSLVSRGIARTAGLMAQHYATSANLDATLAILSAVPRANTDVAAAVLNAIAPPAPPEGAPRQQAQFGPGWPQDRPPSLDARQRAAFGAAAREAGDVHAEAFQRIAARWGMSELPR